MNEIYPIVKGEGDGGVKSLYTREAKCSWRNSEESRKLHMVGLGWVISASAMSI